MSFLLQWSGFGWSALDLSCRSEWAGTDQIADDYQSDEESWICDWGIEREQSVVMESGFLYAENRISCDGKNKLLILKVVDIFADNVIYYTVD